MDQPKSVLNRREIETLSAVAERIFPETDTPGAVQLDAVEYLLIALGGAYGSLAPLYRNGLRAIDRHARERFGALFRALDDAQKDTVLSEFEIGAVPGWKKAAEFFETVRYHVLEGVFCEPQYGGNRNMDGWRMVDFPGQQFGYRDAYIDRRVDLEPVAVDGGIAEDQ